MKRVVTLSGLHGTGKSTIADLIAKEFAQRRVSAGMVFRKLAAERQLSLEEFSKIAENDPSIDQLLDNTLKEEAKKGNVVIDGQLAAWMAGEYADFRILLTAPLEVRVQRIAKRDGKSFEDALKETTLREESEKERYKEYYGIDITDWSIYDLIINTDKFDSHGVFAIVKTAISQLFGS